MSWAAKQRATAPNPPHARATGGEQNKLPHKDTAMHRPGPSYPPADATDDVNMNEVSGSVTLDVTLPNGRRADVSVDYNTPMLDLLVSLAARSKLNPTDLVLILVSEDTGKPLSYKPNQLIGTLGGRVVRIVNKNVVPGKSSVRDSKHERPFEVTHRFTINFPRGQKTVVRVSPSMTLAELLAMLCRDKGLDLDLNKYVLQIPGKPGVPVDLDATILDVGVYEMNLVTVSVTPNRNHTVSMPDLSRPTPADDKSLPVASVAGDHKKKKGLLSFLGKKDKQYKQNVQYRVEPVPSNSGPRTVALQQWPSNSGPRTVAHFQTTTPGYQQQECHLENHLKRPQSVLFPPVTSKDDSHTLQQHSQATLVPTIKKRRAPAPPMTQTVACAPTPLTNMQTFVSAPTISISTQTIVNTPTPSTNMQTVTSAPTPSTNMQTVTSAPTPSTNMQTVTSAPTPSTNMQTVTSAPTPSTNMQTVTSAPTPSTNMQTVTSAPTPSTNMQTVTSAPTPSTNMQTVTSAPTPSTNTQALSINTHSDNCMKTASQGQGQSNTRRQDTIETERTAHNKPTVVTSQAARDQQQVSASAGVPQQHQVSRAEILSHIHSRNSSDSSGYHELTLSGCESPEAPHVSITNCKTSTDAMSIESSENAIGDSAIQGSPGPVSPIVDLHVDGVTGSLPPRKTKPAPPPPTAHISPEAAAVGTLATAMWDTRCSTTALTQDPLTGPVTDAVANTATDSDASLLDSSSRQYCGTGAGQTSAADSSDVLDMPVCDDQLQLVELIFATQSAREESDREMMEETASVVSENIEQVDILSHGYRPCSFIPPPPPLDPPPVEPTVKDLHAETEEAFVTRGTDTRDEHTTDAQASPVHWPDIVHARQTSRISVASMDTAEDISLQFQQAIQLGEEAFSGSLWDVEASVGYKSEMALFVERMSKLAVEKAEQEKHEQLDDSGSCLSVPCSDSTYDTESVIQHHQADSSSEAGSLTRREDEKLLSGHLQTNFNECQENPRDQAVEQLVPCEEISETVVTLPPPPEFDDMDDHFIAEEFHSPIDEVNHNSIHGRSHSPIHGRSHSNDSETNFTQFVQANVNLLDVTSAQSVSVRTTKLEQPVYQTLKDTGTLVNSDTFPDHTERDRGISHTSNTCTDHTERDRGISHTSNTCTDHSLIKGKTLVSSNILTDHSVMKGETVNNDTFADPTCSSNTTFAHISHSQPKAVEQLAKPTSATKEEIILTTEDLENVSFLPAKAKRVKPIHIQPYVQTQPYVRASVASLIMAKYGHLPANSDIGTNMFATEDLQARDSLSLLISQGQESAISKQSQTADDLPSTKHFMHVDSVHIVSNSDVSDASIDPLLTKSRPRLLMNSSSNPSRKSTLYNMQVDSNHKQFANHQRSSYHTGTTSNIAANEIDQPRGTITGVPQHNNTQRASLNAVIADITTDVVSSSSAVTADITTDVVSSSSAVTADITTAVANSNAVTADSTTAFADRIKQKTSSSSDRITPRALLSKWHHLNSTSSGSASVAAVGLVSSPPPPPPPPPPPTLAAPPPSTAPAHMISTTVTTESGVAKQRLKTTFQPQQDLHEQLMAAIRTFATDSMKSVPLKPTSKQPVTSNVYRASKQ